MKTQTSELIREYLANRHDQRQGTVLSVSNALRLFSRFCSSRKLSQPLIEEWIKHLHDSRYSPSYKWKLGLIVRSFIRWCAGSRRVSEDYHYGIKIPSQPPQRPREPFSKAEIDLIVSNLKEDWEKFPVLLAWNTGLAISDCCNLTWGEVDMELGIISRRRIKTGKPTTTTFQQGSELHLALKRRVDEETRRYTRLVHGLPVCTPAFGRVGNYTARLRAALKMSGLDANKTFHNIRATVISDMVNSGVPYEVARQITGITNPKIYASYATVNTETIREHLSKIR